MAVTWAVISVLTGLFGFILGVYLSDLRSRRALKDLESLRMSREDGLRRIADSERDLLMAKMERASADAAAERRELYSRIQAYDPNVGNFTPPDITRPSSRPGEEQQIQERSYTEEELGQMGLTQQADGMIRDTKTEALFETVEDWRFWREDLRRRNLPENVHPYHVREHGWEQAVAMAKLQKPAPKN